MSTPRETKLASERVVIQSPMSITGAVRRSKAFAAKRPWGDNTGGAIAWMILVAIPLAILYVLVAAVWTLIALTILLLPTILWRLFRRSGRKGKVSAAQHREVMSALNQRDRTDA